jgi:hypothetical protein
VQDAPDLQQLSVHNAEDQASAEHDASDASAEFSSQWRRPSEFGNEADCTPRIVACNEVADFLDIPLGLTAEAVLQQAARRFAIRRYFVSSRSSTASPGTSDRPLARP